MFWLVFERLEIICEFSYYLEILFLDGVLYFVNKVQILFAFKIFLFVFSYLSFHFCSFTEIRKFLQVNFDKLNLFFYIFQLLLSLGLGTFFRAFFIIYSQQKIDFGNFLMLLKNLLLLHCYFLLFFNIFLFLFMIYLLLLVLLFIFLLFFLLRLYFDLTLSLRR